jgi:hypothetical protein
MLTNKERLSRHALPRETRASKRNPFLDKKNNDNRQRPQKGMIIVEEVIEDAGAGAAFDIEEKNELRTVTYYESKQ